MARVRSRVGRIAFAFLVLATMGLAIGYGVAQSTLVTQAEWSVYMAQGPRPRLESASQCQEQPLHGAARVEQEH